MKRMSVALLLGLVLLLGMGGAALGAPAYAPANAGSLFVFGEFSPYLNSGDSYPSAGLGYAVTDGLAIGLQGQAAGGDLVPGGFAAASFGPLSANAEYWANGADHSLKVTGLYNLAVGPAKIGVGGGMVQADGSSTSFLEVAGSVGLGKLGVYGAYDYYLDGPVSGVCKAGLTYAF